LKKVTRRAAIGAGLAIAAAAFSSVARPAALGTHGPTARRRETRAIDALLIDETIDMPRPLAAIVDVSRWAPPVVGIRLDAAAHPGLMRVFAKSHALVGITCGATLFCLERIAWDHDLRLTERNEQRANDPRDDAWRRTLATYLGGAHFHEPGPSPLVRSYRPSRADGILHAWVMLKSTREA
jgi:hypothetical protein